MTCESAKSTLLITLRTNFWYFKQISLVSGLVLAIGARASTNSSTISTYTVITTSPVKSISHLHNRMPFILDDSNIDKWIDCNQFTISECLDDIPLEYPNLKFYPVSKIVNSPKNNSIQNIKEEKLNEILSFFPN